MPREEKQLDSALEALIMRVNDLKTAIAAMIYKLDHQYETFSWPTFLDNFALISGHVSRDCHTDSCTNILIGCNLL